MANGRLPSKLSAIWVMAYSAGLVLIYLLDASAQFRSYLVPLIIMAPIPLTVIGVMPGHALLGAQFTATSMIGMIALAGIIVRNSILLVDFHPAGGGTKAWCPARSHRSMPACRACTTDRVDRVLPRCSVPSSFSTIPIFNGLAVSLIFGILVSTVLTLVVIPLLYVVTLRGDTAPRTAQELRA